MRVFLLRHGMTARAESDGERALTESGIQALHDVMTRRPAELQNVTKIHSGPLGRVRETAEIAAAAIGYPGAITDNQSLHKLSRAQEIIATLAELDMTAGDIILVSHESSLCNLMLWLAGEDILMSNSSLSAIETEAWSRGAGRLLWQESPNSSEIKRTSSFVDQF